MITVGIDVHESVLAFGPEDRRALFRRIADAGLDHVTVADHVSFHGGTGFDGMVSAAAALAIGDRLDVWISVYQLALRHPLAVARQLASGADRAGPAGVRRRGGRGGPQRGRGGVPAHHARRERDRLATSRRPYRGGQAAADRGLRMSPRTVEQESAVTAKILFWPDHFNPVAPAARTLVGLRP